MQLHSIYHRQLCVFGGGGGGDKIVVSFNNTTGLARWPS